MARFPPVVLLMTSVGLSCAARDAHSPPTSPTETEARLVAAPSTKDDWRTRNIGPEAVPAPFQLHGSNDRFIGGTTLDDYWTGVLGRTDAFIGKRFIAPELTDLSVPQLERLLSNTERGLWVAGPVPLAAATIPAPRQQARLSVAFPNVTDLPDETLQQLDALTHTLALDGLTTLSPSQVAILSASETRSVVSEGRRQEQPVPDGTLSLRGVADLPTQDLTALAAAHEGLWLSFPGGLTPEQATALVAGQSRTLHLYALPRLDAKAAEVLVAGGLHTLYVEVDTLDPKTAATLASFTGHTLELVVHESLQPKAAQRLSQLAFTGNPRDPTRNRGRLILSLSQPPSVEALQHLGTMPWLTIRGPRPLHEAEQLALIGTGGFRSLGPVTHLGDAAARAMQAADGRFHLHGLESASAAAITAGLGRWFSIDDLRRLDAGAAQALAAQGVHRYTLDVLHADAARALVDEGLRAWKPNETLQVHTTAPLSDETLAALGHYRSATNAFRKLHLSSSEGFSPDGLQALARSCAEGGETTSCGVKLEGIRSIDADLARALELLSNVSLRGVTHIDPLAFPHLCRTHIQDERTLQLRDDESARAYATWKTCSSTRPRIQLDALQTLTPGMAAAFAEASSDLVLELDTLSGEAARALSGANSLRLTIREPIDTDTAAALGKLEGSLRLRLEAPLEPPAARALGALTGDQNAIIYNAPIDAAVMQALASANGRFHLAIEAETLTPELAAALPRSRSSSQTVLDVPDLTLAAAEALTIACAKRGGCGPLDLTTTTASTAALEHLVEHWRGGLLLLPDHSSDGQTVPCGTPQVDTHGCEQLRAMEAMENHDHEADH